MADELVLDASVAAKCFLSEVHSEAAIALVRSDVPLIAPNFVMVELANIAAKKVRLADLTPELGATMVEASRLLFAELAPTDPLIERAFQLACACPLSVYDALYLSLAEQRGAILVTADRKLDLNAQASGAKAEVRVPAEVFFRL